MSEYIPVAEAAAVPAGRGLTVRVDGRLLAIFQLDGRFYAMDGACPHRGAPLGEGWIEGSRVFCPMHGWEFDVTTGACVEKPDKPARCYPTRVLNGTIQVKLKKE